MTSTSLSQSDTKTAAVDFESKEVSDAMHAMSAAAAAAARKRKRDVGPVDKLSKTECRKRLKRMEEALVCPICHEICYCPFTFPCRQHAACHSCIVDLVASRCPIQYKEHSFQFVRSGSARCPLCNSASTEFTADLTAIEPAMSSVMSAFYSDSEEYTCPYCTFKGTMTSLSHHVWHQCKVHITCSFCSETYEHTTKGLQEHMKKCPLIACQFSESCTFKGTLSDLRSHCRLHDKMEHNLQLARFMLGDMSGWNMNVPQSEVRSQVNKLVDDFTATIHHHAERLLLAVSRSLKQTPEAYLTSVNSELKPMFNTNTNTFHITPEALLAARESSDEDDEEEEEEDEDDFPPA